MAKNVAYGVEANVVIGGLTFDEMVNVLKKVPALQGIGVNMHVDCNEKWQVQISDGAGFRAENIPDAGDFTVKMLQGFKDKLFNDTYPWE